MASKWGTSLTVLAGSHGVVSTKGTLREARAYLEEQHGISATYVETKSFIVDEVRGRAKKGEIDLILMGGYSAAPVLEVVLGSTVDEVLREIRLPVLICR